MCIVGIVVILLIVSIIIQFRTEGYYQNGIYYRFKNHILFQRLKEKGLLSLLLCLYSCLMETKNCCEIISFEFNVLSSVEWAFVLDEGGK